MVEAFKQPYPEDPDQTLKVRERKSPRREAKGLRSVSSKLEKKPEDELLSIVNDLSTQEAEVNKRSKEITTDRQIMMMQKRILELRQKIEQLNPTSSADAKKIDRYASQIQQFTNLIDRLTPDLPYVDHHRVHTVLPQDTETVEAPAEQEESLLQNQPVLDDQNAYQTKRQRQFSDDLDRLFSENTSLPASPSEYEISQTAIRNSSPDIIPGTEATIISQRTIKEIAQQQRSTALAEKIFDDKENAIVAASKPLDHADFGPPPVSIDLEREQSRVPIIDEAVFPLEDQDVFVRLHELYTKTQKEDRRKELISIYNTRWFELQDGLEQLEKDIKAASQKGLWKKIKSFTGFGKAEEITLQKQKQQRNTYLKMQRDANVFDLTK